MCPPVEGVTGGAFCALKPLTSSDGFCAASPWQTSDRGRQLGHLRYRHGRALRLALGTVGCAPLCPAAPAPDPDPRSREAPRSSLVHPSRPLWAHAFQARLQATSELRACRRTSVDDTPPAAPRSAVVIYLAQTTAALGPAPVHMAALAGIERHSGKARWPRSLKDLLLAARCSLFNFFMGLHQRQSMEL